MDGDTTERLSQESQCPKDGFHGLLARASVFAIRRNSKPLSKVLFTLHRKDINICNLETCTGEELTPLFTTLHPEPLTGSKRLRVSTIVDFSFIRTFAPSF